MQGLAGRRGKGKKLVTPSASMTTTSPFSTSRTNLAPMMSSAHVSEAEDRAPVELAQHQGTDAERIASADQLVVGQRDEGVSAFDLGQRLDEAIDDSAPARPRRKQQHNLGVGGRLADGARADKLAPQGQAVGQVAVVGDGEAAGLKFGEQRLDVAQRGLARRRIAYMTDRHPPGQPINRRGGGEMIADKALAPLGVEPAAVECDDAGRLLPAMLERMQA